MKKTIFFIRHGETEFNNKGIVQGSGVDSSLNEKGKLQAKAFYDKYYKEDFDMLISSKLKRTKETISDFIATGIPVKATADINEISWGIHEGKSSTVSMKESYNNMIAEWSAGNLDARLEEGESARELMDRLRNFIAKLRNLPMEKILVCSHGRAMRCLICLLLNKSMAEMENVRHANTGLFLVEYDGADFKLILANDKTHLLEAGLD